MELRYIRDTDRREVDFVVECKLSDPTLSIHIPYFLERTHIPKFYQVNLSGKHREISSKIAVLPFQDLCKLENLP